ncbi:MAG: SMC-Scp complex subunit ScpB [Verrucomicrobiota bacterium]
MELKLVLESILFSSQKPLSIAELRQCLKEAPAHSDTAIPKEVEDAKPMAIEKALESLSVEYQDLGRSFRLVCVAGSWQFVNSPDYAPWVKALFGHRPKPARLTQAALETLAIIAYRQPLTRAEAEQIRGVSVDGVLKMLIDRGLVEQAGRAEVLGRPMTFRTTELFLEYFGLKDLEGLPAADELRRIPVEKPPSLDEDESDEDDDEGEDDGDLADADTEDDEENADDGDDVEDDDEELFDDDEDEGEDEFDEDDDADDEESGAFEDDVDDEDEDEDEDEDLVDDEDED